MARTKKYSSNKNNLRKKSTRRQYKKKKQQGGSASGNKVIYEEVNTRGEIKGSSSKNRTLASPKIKINMTIADIESDNKYVKPFIEANIFKQFVANQMILAKNLDIILESSKHLKKKENKRTNIMNPSISDSYYEYNRA